MKYSFLIFILYVCLLSCKKKVPTSIDDLYTEYVDGEFNGRYTLKVRFCNSNDRYFTDTESLSPEIGFPEYFRIPFLSVANEELPWHFQKLKSGKYIIYSKRKNGQYLLWTFYEHPKLGPTGNIPKPSYNMLMKKVGAVLPLNPESFFQFQVRKNDLGQFVILGGSEFVSNYAAFIKTTNIITYADACNASTGSLSLGGPILTSIPYGEQLDGLGNKWAYAFGTSYDVKKLP